MASGMMGAASDAVKRQPFPITQQLTHTNLAQIVVMTCGTAARAWVLRRLRQVFQSGFPQLRGRIMRLNVGPPLEYPVLFRVLGEDPVEVRRIADRVKAIVRANPHTVDVNDDWHERIASLRLKLDQDKARARAVRSAGLSQAVLVFLTAPLGIIGPAFALLLIRAPFGFVALLGMIALAGMIMRNSVILVDQIQQDEKAGRSAFDAIVESSVRRLRPILLTAAAALLAMIPLSRNDFFGPQAIAIMGGLTSPRCWWYCWRRWRRTTCWNFAACRPGPASSGTT